MLKRYATAAATMLVTAVFLLSGCQTGETSRLDLKWGSSFEAARSHQIADPDAATGEAPETGLDGSSAEAVIEKYRGASKEAAVEEKGTPKNGS